MATTIRQHMITCGGACSVVAEINQLLVAFLKYTPALHSDDYFICAMKMRQKASNFILISCIPSAFTGSLVSLIFTCKTNVEEIMLSCVCNCACSNCSNCVLTCKARAAIPAEPSNVDKSHQPSPSWPGPPTDQRRSSP